MTFDDRAFILRRLPHGSRETIACPRTRSGQTIVENSNHVFAAWNNEIRAGGIVVITRRGLGSSIDIKSSDFRCLLVGALHNYWGREALNINLASNAQSASAINWVKSDVELGVAISC